MIPPTTMRVVLNTHEKLNEQVLQRIRDQVCHCNLANPQALERRLTELEREWDTDRVMEAVAALVVLAGVGLAVFHLWWLLVAGAAGLCLLSHSLFGWDPLLPLYRRGGIRTSLEIDYERYALKALRGDFHQMFTFPTPEDRESMARMEGEGGPVAGDSFAPDLCDEAVEQAIAAARR